MDIILRPYQLSLKNKAREAFKKYKRVILLAPCRSGGKTVIAASIMQDSINKGKKVWFIVHRAELLKQASDTLERYGIPKDNIKIYMVQSLAHRLDKIDEIPDLIVVDECFVRGTLIGDKPIEKIKIGDYVDSYNHKKNIIEKKKVLNVFKKRPNNLLKINLSNGKEIVCTSNHQFYTNKGYVEASKLKIKDELYFLLQENNKRKIKGINKGTERSLQRNWKMVLLKRMYGKIPFQSKIREDEKNESKSRVQKCKHRCNKSYTIEKTGARQKKRKFIEKVWVESIEIQKSTSDGTFGGVCNGGYVYNIEVEDNNNYFANGILVHNCQHSSSSTYRKIIDKYCNSFILGLSATPTRLTGKPLGDVYETIVSEITAKQLIQMGFLADYDYYAPLINIRLENVKISKGDYEKEGLDKELNRTAIYGDIIKNYKNLADGKKTIIYCHSIEYSQKIEQLFTKHGYKIKHFDGTTPEKEREKIVEDFRKNKIQILTNVDLIGEGFDVSDCECVILLRPTQSLNLYIQSSTRCLRKNGDKKAVIIDMVNNIQKHRVSYHGS